MAIQGSLKERSLFELLSSLPQENRSGELTLTRGRQKIVISWIDNQVVNAVQQPMPKENNLGELLIAMGKINEVQLQQALSQQRRSLSPLGEILIKLFNCDYTDIQLALRVQAIEIIYSGFFWQRGNFSFEAKPINRSQQHFDPIPIPKLLEEAFPIIETWDRLKKLFHSPELEISVLGDSLPAGLSLGEVELHLFDLLKEKPYKFRELSIASGLGKYLTAYGLYQLHEQQLIVIRQPERQLPDLKKILLGGTLTEFFIWILGTAILIGIISYILIFAPFPPSRFRERVRRSSPTTPSGNRSPKGGEPAISTSASISSISSKRGIRTPSKNCSKWS